MTVTTNEIYRSVDLVNVKVAMSYSVKTTIQHWQLRDLLASSKNSANDEVYFITNNAVNLLSISTSMKKTVIKDIGFNPICICLKDDQIVLGGQRAQILKCSLTGENRCSVNTGGATNNAVVVYDHFGEQRLLVCNNDETIKVYRFEDLSPICTLELPMPVNNVAVSPDRRRLIATGDCEIVYIFDISPGNGGYTQTGAICASPDPGSACFGCDFDFRGNTFAVCSEGGSVSVWDVRKTTPIIQMQTTSATRCVRFSPSSCVSLMAFTEHESRLHVVDARTFDACQHVRVGSRRHELSLTGLAFSGDSSSIYVGREESIVRYPVNLQQRRFSASASLL